MFRAGEYSKSENGTKVFQEDIEVPCNKCPNCLSRNRQDWMFRLKQEARVASFCHFITLTYDNENIPISKKGFKTLCKEDTKAFFKALRKRNSDKIRYYLVGEYGSTRSRPHYHIILFGLQDAEYSHRDPKGYKIYRSKAIEKSWKKGSSYVGEVTPESVAYALEYMKKGKTVPEFNGDDRVPEYSAQSKGIGEAYMTPQMVKWHKDNPDKLYVIDDGHKKPIPRYYYKKMFNEIDKRTQKFYIKKRIEEEEERERRRLKRIYKGKQDYYQYKDEQKYNRFKNYQKQLKNSNGKNKRKKRS